MALFSGTTEILLFAKDSNKKIILANHPFALHLGYKDKSDLMGKSDRELYPASMAQKFEHDDALILEKGESIKNIVELFPNKLGISQWYLTQKIPLRTQNHEIIGLAGMIQPYNESIITSHISKELLEVIDEIKGNYHAPINAESLAKKCAVSPRQFQRVFKQTFHCSPKDFLIKERLYRACDLMSKGKIPLSQVATDVGFYDQSDFSKQFKKHLHMPPMQYCRTFFDKR